MKLRIVEKAIVHYTNKERRRHGLSKLHGNNRLIKAARSHADWCAERNRMTHTGRKGTQPLDRASEAGYSSRGVSENMWQQHGRNNTTYGSRFRWSSDWQFGKAAVTTWMNSPGHRSNLLNPRWTEIGVGLARQNGHTMLVQMLGDRSPPLPKVKLPSMKKSSKPKGGPYSHFHNWSFHTHHNRPKGGNHYRAVRRRQRPWRIGFAIALIAAIATAAIIMGAGWGPSSRQSIDRVSGMTGGLFQRHDTSQSGIPLLSGLFARGSCMLNGETFSHVTDVKVEFRTDSYPQRVLETQTAPALQVRRAPRPSPDFMGAENHYCVIRKTDWPSAMSARLTLVASDWMAATTPRGQEVEITGYDIDHWVVKGAGLLGPLAVWE